MCDLLVVTELSEKLFFSYAEAIRTGKGHIAMGPSGTGKTETAKDFAKKLGKHMVVINCSD
jgi:MoxR-like ATPase